MRRDLLCAFRGLANDVYYMLDKERAQYANYSGTGNTLNANQRDRAPPDSRQPAILGR